MYGPSRSHYGGYGNYWGGYGRPPHPPPPPPIPPHEPQSFQPPLPPPPHFRHMRPPPHAFQPPPPPPPVRLPRPQQNQPPYPPHHHYPPHPRQPRHLPPQLPQDRKAAGVAPNYPSDQNNFRPPRHSNSYFPSTRPPQPPPPPPQADVKSEGDAYSPEKQEVQENHDNHELQEPQTGSPLVPRHKEPESPPQQTPTRTPNNKRPLPVELDPNLPEELVAKFHNNSCELCDVKLNSRIQAKNHYEGKQHTKKVRNYIIENSRKDGQPPAKLPKIDLSTSKKKVEPLDVSQLYCKCCELSFTSEQHAQQHYLGRNHQRVLHGLKPLRAGYFNKDTGKWQRMPPDPRVAAERLGMSPPEDGTEVAESGEDAKRPPLDPDDVKDRGRFFCELCNVSATSQDQLEGHTSGQRHIKATRLAQRNTSTPATPATPSGPMDSILASVIKADETKKTKTKDLSIYRTPSGKYYCSPCDLTLNSESQFAQHVDSKKHKTRRVK